MPKQSNMRQRVYKNTTELLVLWRLLLDMSPAPACALLSQLDSSGENKFFLCKRVSREDTFLIRGGSPDFPFSRWNPVWLNLRGPCACCQSV